MTINQKWWNKPAIPVIAALQRQRQEISELEVGLIYTESSKAAKVT